MSMATCKCGKVFDSDFQMGMDEKGNCCCDECETKIYNKMYSDIEKVFNRLDELVEGNSNFDAVGTAVDMLLEMGYRKIK